MKILLIHPHDIFSRNEPWTVRITSLSQEFKKAGHQVKLAYCLDNGKGPKMTLESLGIGVIPLSRQAGIKSLFSNTKKLKDLAQWADVIHFQKCFHYITLPALFWGWVLHKPLHYDWDDWEEKIWYQ